jgi:light-regulated signal transduction histidine kinase (bacteriophytochrome)
MPELSEHDQASLARRLARAESALRQVDDELETLRHAVAHDLRAPLRSIEGFSRAVLEDHAAALPEPARADLERVRAAGARMARLIDELVGMLHAARPGFAVERVDLSALATAVAQTLRRAEPGRRVTFEIEPGLVDDGDRRLLRVALEHLLGNAWKFTRPKPEARIAFAAVARDARRGYVVRDDGVGFDPRWADKLFTAFQRLHPTAEFEGIGIGLATVRRIVARHRGEVWAEGSPGAGATFGFTLDAGEAA